jgi:hypothetical protein
LAVANWVVVRPELIERWDEDFDPEDFVVDRLDGVLDLIAVAMVLLKAADPEGYAEFERLYYEGMELEPPHWADERLVAFRDAAGRIPDPADKPGGFWTLSDETVLELMPKLPFTSRHVDSPVEKVRESVKAEWWNSLRLHSILAKAAAGGYAVISD